MKKLTILCLFIIISFVGCGSNNNNSNNFEELFHKSNISLGNNIFGYKIEDMSQELFRYSISTDNNDYEEFLNDINISYQQNTSVGNMENALEVLNYLSDLKINFEKHNIFYFSRNYESPSGSSCEYDRVLSFQDKGSIASIKYVKPKEGSCSIITTVTVYIHKVSKDIKKIILHDTELENKSTPFKALESHQI